MLARYERYWRHGCYYYAGARWREAITMSYQCRYAEYVYVMAYDATTAIA